MKKIAIIAASLFVSAIGIGMMLACLLLVGPAETGEGSIRAIVGFSGLATFIIGLAISALSVLGHETEESCYKEPTAAESQRRMGPMRP